MALPSVPLDPRVLIVLDGIAKHRGKTRKQIVSEVIAGRISRQTLVDFMLLFWVCPLGGPATLVSMAAAFALTGFFDALHDGDDAARDRVPEVLDGIDMIYHALATPLKDMPVVEVGHLRKPRDLDAVA